MASGLTIGDAKSLIPEFDGTSENLHRFLNICEMFQKEDTPEAEKTLFLQIIKTKLVGRAYDVVKYNDINTWKELQNSLQEQFLESRSRLSLQNEILALRQYPRESTKDYAFRTRKLLALYDDTTSIITNDQTLRNLLVGENLKMVLRAFEDGLKDDHIRLLTKAKSHDTLSASTKFAIEQSERNVAFQERLSICTKCSKKGHTADACYSVKIKTEPKPKLICSYCKIPNHHISECRKRLFQQQVPRTSPHNTHRGNQSQGYQPQYSNIPNQRFQTTNRFQRPQTSSTGPPRQPPNIRAASTVKPSKNKRQNSTQQQSENELLRDGNTVAVVPSRLNQLTVTADVHPHPHN